MKEELKKQFENVKENIREALEKDNEVYLFATSDKLFAIGENYKLLVLLSQIADSLKKEIPNNFIINAVKLGLAEDKKEFMKNSLIKFMQDTIDSTKEE